MVVSRKNKPSHLATNLIFLRNQKGKTLEEMADFLGLSGKSSYLAYEQQRALPDIHKLLKLAGFFDVAVADLLYQDLQNMKGEPETRRLFEIAKVPIAAYAGYARSFGDTDYIMRLDKIKIPYEPYGIARAFDISGNSMEPLIREGSTVIGIKIDSSEIRDNKAYILVTTEGVQCKNVRIDDAGEILYLISRNEEHKPTHLRTENVLEMWEVWKIL